MAATKIVGTGANPLEGATPDIRGLPLFFGYDVNL